MRRAVRSTIERGTRVGDFHRLHPHTDADATALATRLDDAVAHAEALAVQQRNGTLASRNANARKVKLRKGVLGDTLRHLAHVSVSAGAEKPELIGSLKFPPENSTHQAFLVAARQMVELAEANKEVLAKYGFTGSMLTDLTANLGAFEAASAAAQAAAGSKAGARSELEAVTRQIRDLIRLLDGINRHRFQDNADQLAEWSTAISFISPPRRNKTDSETPSPQSGVPSS